MHAIMSCDASTSLQVMERTDLPPERKLLRRNDKVLMDNMADTKVMTKSRFTLLFSPRP